MNHATSATGELMVAMRRRRSALGGAGWWAATAAELAPQALRFPPGFNFGAATSAHQVEGDTGRNNWSQWERTRRPDGSPRIHNGQRCGRAVDHWRRFSEDLELMRWLGIRAYRFSLEWSRIEPLLGYFDDAALQRYRRWCEQLRDAGIAPVITLHHFTEPAWFAERGSFANRSAISTFGRFVEHAVSQLIDLVDCWVTINEPVGYAVQGWWRGEWPPGHTNPATAASVVENLLLAHAHAYRLIHRLARDRSSCWVGLAHNLVAFRPRRRFHPGDRLAARLLDGAYNRAVLQALATGELRLRLPGLRHEAVHPVLCGTQDYLGLTHYYPLTVRFHAFSSDHFDVDFTEDGDHNDLGWSLDPTSLTEVLALVRGYRLPIVVLEHGICDSAQPDERRRRFLAHSLDELRRVIEQGTDVRGYLHWSLLDNFEWTYGFTPRFGLFRVDHTTGARSPTSSADFYRRLIAAQPAHDKTPLEQP
jgi:beta-glucosidase